MDQSSSQELCSVRAAPHPASDQCVSSHIYSPRCRKTQRCLAMSAVVSKLGSVGFNRLRSDEYREFATQDHLDHVLPIDVAE